MRWLPKCFRQPARLSAARVRFRPQFDQLEGRELLAAGLQSTTFIEEMRYDFRARPADDVLQFRTVNTTTGQVGNWRLLSVPTGSNPNPQPFGSQILAVKAVAGWDEPSTIESEAKLAVFGISKYKNQLFEIVYDPATSKWSEVLTTMRPPGGVWKFDVTMDQGYGPFSQSVNLFYIDKDDGHAWHNVVGENGGPQKGTLGEQLGPGVYSDLAAVTTQFDYVIPEWNVYGHDIEVHVFAISRGRVLEHKVGWASEAWTSLGRSGNPKDPNFKRVVASTITLGAKDLFVRALTVEGDWYHKYKTRSAEFPVAWRKGIHNT